MAGRPITLRWTGTQRVNKGYKGSTKKALDGVEKATKHQIKAVFKASQFLCPVDTTSLKQSGRVTTYRYKRAVSSWIRYGGLTPGPYGFVEYAVYVHEDLTKKHKPPTQAKFVEKPLIALVPQFKGTLKFYVSGELQKTFKGKA